MEADISPLIAFAVCAAAINRILYLAIPAFGEINPSILFVDQKLFDDPSIRTNNFSYIVTAGIFHV
jgi:hypothetical protein